MNDVKIPSSLKWLVTRRARITGELTKAQAKEARRVHEFHAEIARLEAEQAEVQRMHSYALTSHAALCNSLEQDLLAMDQVLRLHEIQIDPDLIASIRSQENMAATDHGQMTRLIYECLRLNEGQACTATQAALHITTMLGNTGGAYGFSDLRYRVRKRLQHLAWEGKLERMHEQKGALEGKWRLPRASENY